MTKTAIDASDPDDALPDDAFSVAGRRAFELLSRAAQQWQADEGDPVAAIASLRMAASAVELAKRAAVRQARENGSTWAEIAAADNTSRHEAWRTYSGGEVSLE